MFIGDDRFSFAYDGHRVLKWHDGSENFYWETSITFWTDIFWSKDQVYGKAWKTGDIVGCAIDINANKIKFFLNGEDLGDAFVNINEFTTPPFYPAITMQYSSTKANMIFRSSQFK